MLVVRYAYLWRDEAARGREEGAKDRPCDVIVAVHEDSDELLVAVAPITHRPPAAGDRAVELPSATKDRLGLDKQRSWILPTTSTVFAWLGPDLRPIAGKPGAFALALIPAALYELVRQSVLTHVTERSVQPVERTK